jgi:hypothetical protein
VLRAPPCKNPATHNNSPDLVHSVDLLELIARSEWPVVVGGALFLFRRPLVKLIGRINSTKVEALGFKAEFEMGLEEVENLTPPSTEELELVHKITHDEKGKGENLSQWIQKPSWSSYTPEPSPEAVVLGAWTWLEVNTRAMIEAIHPRNYRSDIFESRRLYEAAREFGLTEDDIKSLGKLHELRNKVAHSTESILTWDDAMRFKEATERLVARMKVKWEEIRPKQSDASSKRTDK